MASYELIQSKSNLGGLLKKLEVNSTKEWWRGSYCPETNLKRAISSTSPPNYIYHFKMLEELRVHSVHTES